MDNHLLCQFIEANSEYLRSLRKLTLDSYSFDMNAYNAIIALRHLPSKTLTVECRLGITWYKSIRPSRAIIAGRDPQGNLVGVPISDVYAMFLDNCKLRSFGHGLFAYIPS
mmetsp:Transcript_5993/g.6969  ORF Transcript_5993/g.6969 Transcript_5993/m.6969 type:complete len:111 (+) Transcript_5993:272-604(+)